MFLRTTTQGENATKQCHNNKREREKDSWSCLVDEVFGRKAIISWSLTAQSFRWCSLIHCFQSRWRTHPLLLDLDYCKRRQKSINPIILRDVESLVWAAMSTTGKVNLESLNSRLNGTQPRYRLGHIHLVFPSVRLHLDRSSVPVANTSLISLTSAVRLSASGRRYSITDTQVRVCVGGGGAQPSRLFIFFLFLLKHRPNKRLSEKISFLLRTTQQVKMDDKPGKREAGRGVECKNIGSMRW